MFLVIAVIANILIARKNSHHKKITKKINSLGGTVIKIESTHKAGPFIWREQGSMIYRIKYKMGDTIKVGWVHFNIVESWKL